MASLEEMGRLWLVETRLKKEPDDLVSVIFEGDGDYFWPSSPVCFAKSGLACRASWDFY